MTKAGQNYLTETEEKIFFKTISSRKGWKAERDYALLYLTRMLGLRRAESLSLNVGDVAGKDKLVVDTRIAKKGATGELAIPVSVQTMLKRYIWLKRAQGEDVDSEAPLFVSKKGNRLSIRAFNDLMDYWCEEAKIPRYTPHALRHTKGQRIMSDTKVINPEDRNRAILFVQKQLRHRSLNSTAIYTAPTKEVMALIAEV